MRLAAAYLRTMAKSPKLYLCILGCALLTLGGICGNSNFTSFSGCFNYIANNGLAVFFELFIDLSTYRKLLIIVACIPFTSVFSAEVKSGYTRSAVLRSSRENYIIVHIALSFFFTFIVSFLGMMLCAGILSLFLPVACGTNTYSETFNSLLNSPDTAWLYIFFKAFIYSFSLGTWSVSGTLISALFPEPFIAVCTPLITSYILEFVTIEIPFLPDLWDLSRGYNAIFEGRLPAFLYIIFIFLLLGGIFGTGFYFAADRRLRN